MVDHATMSRFEPEDLPDLPDDVYERRERQRLAHDNGVDRETRPPPPCSKRLDNGGWCVNHDGHEQIGLPCQGPPRKHGPDAPPPDRRLMGAFRHEISEKYDTKKDETGTSPGERWTARAEGRAQTSG
jgi:hypothetical protein